MDKHEMNMDKDFLVDEVPEAWLLRQHDFVLIFEVPNPEE